MTPVRYKSDFGIVIAYFLLRFNLYREERLLLVPKVLYYSTAIYISSKINKAIKYGRK